MQANLVGQLAVVTGASSGVGRAVAVALRSAGVRTCLVGRNRAALSEIASRARESSPPSGFEVEPFVMDLTIDADIEDLCRQVRERFGRVDLLIHSAGVFASARMERARIEDFDLQYRVNVRAPYLLTQNLLPMLEAARGQIVFINSSVGQTAKRPEVGQYAATKHALKAIADSLREEVNPKGIRVLTVYLGRTATPMQAAIHCEEGKTYQPETLLQPEDVASAIIAALQLPRTAEITDIQMRPAQARPPVER